MEQRTDVSYQFLREENEDSEFPLLKTVYKSSCTQECLDEFTSYLKKERDNLYDYREHLVGSSDSQLALYSKEFPRRKNRVPLQLLEMFNHNLDQHLTGIFGEIPWLNEAMWVNYMRPNDFQPIHHHTGTYSYVWYIDVPPSIYSEEDAPYGQIHFVTSSRYSPHQVDILKIQPQTGDLLIFDSSHTHVVYPYRADVERISIAGNIIHANLVN